MEKLEERIVHIIEKDDPIERNNVLSEYQGFVLKHVSKTTGRYISSDRDDEFVIGLEAFNEAIDRFEEGKGGFLYFASILIRNRVIDYMRREMKRGSHLVSDDEVILQKPANINQELVDEIRILTEALKVFDIDFLGLSEESPKHEEVRLEVQQLAISLSEDDYMVQKIYDKKHLPIKEIALKYNQPQKRIKRFKKYIIAIIIIMMEELDLIQSQFAGGGPER